MRITNIYIRGDNVGLSWRVGGGKGVSRRAGKENESDNWDNNTDILPSGLQKVHSRHTVCGAVAQAYDSLMHCTKMLKIYINALNITL